MLYILGAILYGMVRVYYMLHLSISTNYTPYLGQVLVLVYIFLLRNHIISTLKFEISEIKSPVVLFNSIPFLVSCSTIIHMGIKLFW